MRWSDPEPKQTACDLGHVGSFGPGDSSVVDGGEVDARGCVPWRGPGRDQFISRRTGGHPGQGPDIGNFWNIVKNAVIANQ